MNSRLLLFLFIGLLMYSCIPQKKVIYMQKNESEDLIAQKKSQYKVHSHDILKITITSLNPEVSQFFNLGSQGEKLSSSTYTVNDSGYINLPVLDSIKVSGMTIPEIKITVEKLVKEHVTDATVVVALAHFNITVLGEVGSPGLIGIEGDELTVLEAIGLAKDISDFGNKKKVRLIRKEGNSTRFVTLDLTSREIVASEYFYLQPNDVLYVEPLKAKNYKLNVAQLTLLVGLSSLFFLVLNVIKK